MRKIFFLVIIPSFILAQYWGERVTEKSYENSDLFFNSYYLNTFGIYQFRDVSKGLFNDPFLRLHLNPALLPEDTTKTEVYLDFRGDRTEAEVIQYNYYPPYYYNGYYDKASIMPIIDPRWYAVTRTEPEPVFSFGILTHPFSDRLFAGATYQMIFRQEPYYQQPTGIYNSRYGKSAYGDELIANSDDIPIIDRYSGSDEMLTRGHLFSGFVGYQLTPKINVGLNINSVIHEREGQYANLNNDLYSTSNNYNWFNTNSVKRNSNYDHIDLNAGINYKFTDQFSLGFKLGQLDGKAKQSYSNYDSSVYSYNNDSENWSQSFSSGATDQHWRHDGTSQYGTITMDYQLAKSTVSFYFDHRQSDIKLKTNSTIDDTSYYSGEWTSNYYHSMYESYSSLSDIRNSHGDNDVTKNEAMLSIRWRETEKVTAFIGFYFAVSTSKIKNYEPVVAMNQYSSKYNYDYTDPASDDYDYSYFYSKFEDKNLVWTYESFRQSIQIPVVFDFHLTKNWNLKLGVNRIWEYWDISEHTIALFSDRTENQNGNITTDKGFGERYTQPDRKFTDNLTEFMAGFSVDISPKLNVNILVEPDTEPEWRIAQWWLSFRAKL
jgi:hypothetical protein